jgi:hypothetical protein
LAAFYLDNDVSTGIAGVLIVQDHTATTALAQQLQGANDAQHLLVAALNKWVLVVHNRDDFLLLHRAWMLWRGAGVGYMLPDHPGILSIPQQRWANPEAAQHLNDFVQTNVVLPNRFYQWTPSRGWVERY